MLGIDADYRMSRDYMAQGWPTFLVIDAEGKVRFHGFDSDRSLSGLRGCLKGLLRVPAAESGQIITNGVAYPAGIWQSQTARREQSPRLAFDSAGVGHILYHSNREGTNAVYWRRYGAKAALLGETRLSPAGMDAYAPDCNADSSNAVWVAWCGRRAGEFYNVFAQVLRAGEASQPEQLTSSDDDAMSPRIATGPGGTVTVTYYKWAKMQGISRDRNVFARTYDPAKRAWAPEREISPPQPAVEDHTDPDVAIDRDGHLWIVWSYDYHPQLFKNPLPAEQPTIFAADYSSGKVGEALLVGATGRLRGAIDLFPSASFDSDGVLWCAWDCSEPQRSIQLARLRPGQKSFESVHSCGRQTCSTPELSSTTSGQILLAWSERNRQGAWQGRVALLNEGVAAHEAVVADDGEILFPQARQSPDGHYWVTYQKTSSRGSEVVLRDVTADVR